MTDRRYLSAAFLLFLSSLLHVPVAVLDVAAYGVAALVAVVVLTVLGAGLMQARRWVAWLAFLGMLVGVIVAVGVAAGTSGMIAGLWWAIAAVDAVAVLELTMLLWRSPPREGV